DPGVRPEIVVFDCIVAGARIQVLPPSMLYCHSYDERGSGRAVTSFTEPDTGPGFAAKTRGGRGAGWRTESAALSMIEALVSGLALATVWTYARSSCSCRTSAARFSLRVVTAPFARPSAAVCAACRSSTPVVSAASDGVGLGKFGLPVSALTIALANRM